MVKKKEKGLVDYLFEHPEKLKDFNDQWRKATQGMTKAERKDFAKWHDELMEA